jgi:hypothetical protein
MVEVLVDNLDLGVLKFAIPPTSDQANTHKAGQYKKKR